MSADNGNGEFYVSSVLELTIFHAAICICEEEDNILGIYQSRAQLFLLLHPANPGSHIELNGSHLFCASKPPHKLHCLDIKPLHWVVNILLSATSVEKRSVSGMLMPKHFSAGENSCQQTEFT